MHNNRNPLEASIAGKILVLQADNLLAVPETAITRLQSDDPLEAYNSIHNPRSVINNPNNRQLWMFVIQTELNVEQSMMGNKSGSGSETITFLPLQKLHPRSTINDPNNRQLRMFVIQTKLNVEQLMMGNKPATLLITIILFLSPMYVKKLLCY